MFYKSCNLTFCIQLPPTVEIDCVLLILNIHKYINFIAIHSFKAGIDCIFFFTLNKFRSFLKIIKISFYYSVASSTIVMWVNRIFRRTNRHLNVRNCECLGNKSMYYKSRAKEKLKPSYNINNKSSTFYTYYPMPLIFMSFSKKKKTK